MKRGIAILLAGFVLALPLGFGSFGAAFAQEERDCVGAREAQQAVESGEIMELPDAARRAGSNGNSSVSRRLCNVNGSPTGSSAS